MSSSEIFGRARARIPGGVNSPVRAFNSVGGEPIVVRSGAGAYITTEDDRTLIDYCGSWGPLILGHAYEPVVAAVREAAGRGMTFGISTAAEVEMAELLAELAPHLEMSRLVSSGTEAAMTALRLARGYTGRQGIIKFDGCYHGHSDAFLVAAGSGLLTGGISSSAGVPDAAVADVYLAPYNDLDAVAAIVAERGPELAAIVVEPMAGNMGLIAPAPGFLEGLRRLCDECGALLVFDEVITGFRLGPHTYAQVAGVTPDITCLGKIVGGGMPIGAIGGPAAIMEKLAPLGPVYQAGTLSGNPVAVAAGIATLRILRDDPPYSRLAEYAEELAEGITAAAARVGRPLHVERLGGMFTIFFREGGTPHNLAEVKSCDTAAFAQFFRGMLDRGIYISPSQFELGFVSAAHSAADIATTIAAANSVLDEMAG